MRPAFSFPVYGTTLDELERRAREGVEEFAGARGFEYELDIQAQEVSANNGKVVLWRADVSGRIR